MSNHGSNNCRCFRTIGWHVVDRQHLVLGRGQQNFSIIADAPAKPNVVQPGPMIESMDESHVLK